MARQTLKLIENGGRIAALSPKSTQRQVQLVLKRICLLDANIQERKTISQAQRMVLNRARTAATSARSTSITPRPSTSNVTTLSLDGNVLSEQQQSTEKLTGRSSSSGLEGYMNSYYRNKTNGQMFQIGDLLPAVDDHSNKNNKPRRKYSNNSVIEGESSVHAKENSYFQADKDLLRHEDKIFMVKEGVDLRRLKERQQAVSVSFSHLKSIFSGDLSPSIALTW